MVVIIGMAGSLRTGSINAALLHAAAGLMPSDSTLDLATINGIPLYDGDLDAREGIPQPGAALKEQIAAADGLLRAAPAYNNGILRMFKSAIDWLSWSPDRVARRYGV